MRQLKEFSDAELQAELNRRNEERIKKAEANKVWVVCPLCEGIGYKTFVLDAINEEKEDCVMCEGKKKIKAMKA